MMHINLHVQDSLGFLWPRAPFAQCPPVCCGAPAGWQSSGHFGIVLNLVLLLMDLDAAVGQTFCLTTPQWQLVTRQESVAATVQLLFMRSGPSAENPEFVTQGASARNFPRPGQG